MMELPWRWMYDRMPCERCGTIYVVTGPEWQMPEDMDGEPIAPRLRQLLAELSRISGSPEKFTLAQEVAATEELLRFLMSTEGRTTANFWCVREWTDYSGEDTSYAPDMLNDIYADLGRVGAHETPEALLERLEQFKRTDEFIRTLKP
jgi:hypothetical protein